MTLFIPLVANLEPYFEVSFDEIPADVQELVEARDLLLFRSWNSLPPDKRRHHAENTDGRAHSRREIDMFGSLWFLQNNVKEWIDTAERDQKDAAVVYLRKVADQIERIFGSNREQVEKQIKRIRSTQENESQSKTKLNTYLLIIYALKGYLLDGLPGEETKPIFRSQAELIATLEQHYSEPEFRGMGERNLETIFAAANRIYKER